MSKCVCLCQFALGFGSISAGPSGLALISRKAAGNGAYIRSGLFEPGFNYRTVSGKRASHPQMGTSNIRFLPLVIYYLTDPICNMLFAIHLTVHEQFSWEGAKCQCQRKCNYVIRRRPVRRRYVIKHSGFGPHALDGLV